VIALSNAGRLNKVWPTVSARDFSPEELDKHSTTFDVLKALHETDQFAPYVGSHGVAVVTGGTGGIGLPTIEAIARTDMRIVLCTRDPEEARRAVSELCSASPINKHRIRIQPMDLSDLSSIEAAVQEIIRVEKKVDVLLNCAGINSIPTRQKTAQNFELQFGVNHVGHHFLTRLLLPEMRPWGRVVTVSSQAHNKARNLFLDDLNFSQRRYCPYGAYCQSKLANILFAEALQEKIKASSSDIMSLSLHPGTVLTNMWRQSGDMVLGAVADYITSKTPDQGASTSVYCCLADANHFKGGDYVVDCKPSLPSVIAIDEGAHLRHGLWETTEKMIHDAGFHLAEELL